VTQALDELFASNPVGVSYYLTLEISHSAFVPNVFRLVQGFNDVTATLESGAAFNAGEAVLFLASAFEVSLPEKNVKGRQDMSVTLHGAAIEAVRQLELQRAANREPIKLRFREFESGDLSSPASPTVEMTVVSAVVNSGVVELAASFADVINKSFPSTFYKTLTHPGLA
jgi:hypothetical protein